MIEATPQFESVKIQLVNALGINADACHIYVGLILFVLAAAVFRKRGVRPWMLIPVIVSAILGEILDAKYQIHALGYWEWDKSLRDIVNTVLMPVVLYYLLKLRLLTGMDSNPVPPEEALD